VTTTFATIGSGRRTRFFLRLAGAMPERLRVGGVVTRDPGRADARQAGPPPYPLAEACQDHLISVAIGESVRSGGHRHRGLGRLRLLRASWTVASQTLTLRAAQHH